MVFSRICRACASEVNEAHEIDNNLAKPELSRLLQRYVPEFDIKIENACLCTDCVSILYLFHNLKRKSLRTEEDIRLHIRKHPEVKTVNINDVFTPKEQANNTIDGIEPSLETTAPPQVLTLSAATTIFACEICCRSFYWEQSLLVHKRKYHKHTRHYKCDKCSKNFASKNLYGRHLEYHEEEPCASLYTCKICKFVYHSQSALSAHNSYKHSSKDRKRFKCEVCAKRFTARTALHEHMRTHALEKVYYCSKCKYVTTVTTELDKHIEKAHNIEAKTKVKCPHSSCRHVFASEKLLETHKQTFHAGTAYQCDKCSRDFALKKKYEEHLTYHKKPDAILYTCKICNFLYHTKSALKKHNIYKHTSEDQKRFKCEVCARRFVTSSILYGHMRTHTLEKLYYCTKCKYVTTVATELDTHIRKVHNIEHKKVKCPHSNCHRVFVSKHSLEAHKQNFHARTRYQCDQCSREFTLEKAYQRHLAYHKRPSAGRHTCKICNFVYHTYVSLRSHNISKHSSDDKKPFHCEICSVRFIQKIQLTTHMRTHTGEKPYKCPLCTYAAALKGGLYKHFGARHTNIKVIKYSLMEKSV